MIQYQRVNLPVGTAPEESGLMTTDPKFTREQEMLMWLRDEKCGKNAAELARRIGKDPTYVNRLLYPIGKDGRKGIGLEVMRKASAAFDLPPGFWEGADADAAGAGKYAPLLRDLEDIPQAQLAPLVQAIQQAAEQAREAVAHFAARDGKQAQFTAGEQTHSAMSAEERAQVAAMREEATNFPPPSPDSTKENK
jgi:hypothetical protein